MTHKEFRLKKDVHVAEIDSAKKLTDEKFIGEVILDCLKSNDPEGLREVFAAYLEAVNTSQSC